MCNCLSLAKIGNWQLMCKGESLIHRANYSPHLLLPFGRWPAQLGQPMAGWRSNIWWCHGSIVVARGGNEVCWVKGGGGGLYQGREYGGRRRACGREVLAPIHAYWWLRNHWQSYLDAKLRGCFFVMVKRAKKTFGRKENMRQPPPPRKIKKMQS